jgi:glucose-1-phosphate thymidylyltransferase
MELDLEFTAMRAVILAAGEGRRLRPYTVSEPKVMLPAGNRPILEHVVNAVVQAGVKDITIVIGYKKESIISHFDDGKRFNCQINYVTQKNQLGTAHALSLVEPTDDDVLVLAGDNYVSMNLIKNFLGEVRKIKKNEHAMLLSESSVPSKYGVVILKENYVHQIEEKPSLPETSVINTGIYVIRSHGLKTVKELVEEDNYALSSVMQVLSIREGTRGIFADGIWADAVYPWDILRLNTFALGDLGESLGGTIEGGCRISGKVIIGEGSIIRANTCIQGPVVIGEECDIGPNVVISPSTSIGKDVVIEANTFIRNSVIMSGAFIGGLSYLSHSVIGRGTHLGPHFSASEGKAFVRPEDRFHEVSGIGGIIGEDVHISDNVVVSPGVIVHAKSKISSMKYITRNVTEGAIVE